MSKRRLIVNGVPMRVRTETIKMLARFRGTKHQGVIVPNWRANVAAISREITREAKAKGDD